jgi:polyisoprenyl-teichoic acid--peptidoglycan teichoic acid transferase
VPDNPNKSEANQSTEPQPGRAKITRAGTPAQRRWRKTGYAFGTVGCLLFMAAGTVFGCFYWGSKTIQEAVNRNPWGLIKGFATGDILQAWTPEQQFPGRTSMNVLVLGVDHDYDNRAQIIKTTHGRSDSIMLVRVDFVTGAISALTIPRDSAVRVPGHRGVRKINAAHSLGGPLLTIDTIKSVFGVDVDAVVSINFEGFQKLVDAIGGIDLNVEKKLDYDDNWGRLHIHLKPGYQHLTGYEAMGYVRMRHSDSDLMRSKRQHAFLEAVRAKIKQPGTFRRLPKAVDQLNDTLKRVNLTEDQMFALANFARTLPKERIVIETLPSFEGPSYVTIDTEKSAEVIQRLFFPYQQVALNIDAPDPNSVRSMNSRYDRGSSGSRRRSRSRRVQSSETPTLENSTDGSSLTVEDPSSSATPQPPAGGTQGGPEGGTDPKEKEIPPGTSG